MENSRGSCSSDSGNKSCNRGHWRPAEDEKLRRLVDQYGPQNWNFIAEHLQGRSGKSCRLRWYNQLDPNINKKPFTEEEEERLLKAHQIQGNRWASIARLFPGKTDNAVKNHYHVIMARRKRERLMSSYGKRSSSFQVHPDALSNQNNNNMATGFNGQRLFTRPQLDRDTRLGFLINERKGYFPVSSSSSSPSWTMSASTITNETLGFDANKRKDVFNCPSPSLHAKDGWHVGLSKFFHNHRPSFSIYDVSGHQIPNSNKAVSSPFALMTASSGMSCGNKEVTKSQSQPLTLSNGDSDATWKLPVASQQGPEGGGAIKNKDVSFIDFLGLGIS